MNAISLTMPTQPLSGKSALVTGGARRIGREIALALARAGADVAITYRTSHAEAAQTAHEIEALGRRAFAVECDVRSEASVRQAVAAAFARLGRLDLLVNNAAVFDSAALDRISLEQWDTVFETNTRGPFLVAREALAHLRAVQGRIVNIGSLGGIHAWAGHAHYCASKAALHMLTQAMAKAFAPEVSVNCVAPGWIELDERSSDDARRFAARTPMRRNGRSKRCGPGCTLFRHRTQLCYRPGPGRRWRVRPLLEPVQEFGLSKSLDFNEGYGLQPVHKPSKMSWALAPEGCSFLLSPRSFQASRTGSYSGVCNPWRFPIVQKADPRIFLRLFSESLVRLPLDLPHSASH